MTYTVRAHGRLQTAEEFGAIVLRSNSDGSTVRMRDVARIELGALNYQQIGRVNGQPGVGVAVFQAPGSNALAVARGVRAQMDLLRARFPADLDFAYARHDAPGLEGIKDPDHARRGARPRRDRRVSLPSELARHAHPDARRAGVARRHVRGVSAAGLLDQHAVALRPRPRHRLVVDDAIVVVEAVEHHIEEGMSPREATLKAMQEVSGPVIGIALILAAVFIPVGVMSGIQGRLNQQFAITIAVSVLISAFNALTLSPALSAMLLRPRKKTRGPVGRFFDAFNRWLTRSTDGYVSLSHGLIRKPLVGIGVLVLFTVMTALIGQRLPTSFLPEEDYGYALLNIQLPPAASLERTDAVARKDRDDPQEDRGREELQHDHRLQPAHARDGEQQRVLLRPVRSLGRAARSALQPARSSTS